MNTIRRPSGDSIGGFEDRLLAELKTVVAEQAPKSGHAEVHRRGWRPWSVRGVVLTAATSAAVAVGLAVALTVPFGGANAHRGGTHMSAFVPATSASAVLHNAALAAYQQRVVTPQPDQFVYSKVYLNESGWPKPMVVQTWLSVDGKHFGLRSETGGALAGSTPEPACVNGQQTFPHSHGPVFHAPCTPATLAAYSQTMPTSTGPLRVYLERMNHIRAGRAGAVDLLWAMQSMLTRNYLIPAQRAALYRVLAQTQGLNVVPNAATLLGRAGVGVRWRGGSGRFKGSSYTLVFSRSTYQLLGMNWTGRLGLNGASGGEVLTRLALVDRAGQLP